MSTHGPRVVEALAIVDELRALDVNAGADPAWASTNRPCVLVAPPVIDWTAGTIAGPQRTWRLVCLASHPAGTFAAWDQLDELVAQLEAAGVNVERADPVSYALGADTVPAYLVTTTT